MVVKLEDGLGWEQICSFTGDKIPAVPYPRGNEPKDFEVIANEAIKLHWKEAFIQWVAVAVGVACAGYWIWNGL